MGIYVWGTGCGASELIEAGLEKEKIAAFVDRFPMGETFLGRKVLLPEQLPMEDCDLLIITARHAEAIGNRCRELGIPAEKCLFLKNNMILTDRNASCIDAKALLGEELLKKPYERIVLWVNAEQMTEFFARWPELNLHRNGNRRYYLLRTAGMSQERELRDAFLRGCRESEKRRPGWEAALYGNTNLLLTLLLRAMEGVGEEPMREKTDLLDELLIYVSEHLQEKITVRDTARKLHVSESTVTHLCSKRLGLSFYRYVTQQRLDKARQLMLKNEDLSSVAEKAGFCDYTAFFRAFKQEYGLSPSEYRKIHG